jgi:hypothetical protein
LESEAIVFIQLMFTTEDQLLIEAPSAIGLYIDGGALFGFLGKQKGRKLN